MPASRPLRNIARLPDLRVERVLQIRGTLATLMFAAFNVFWNALVPPLSAPPYMLSHCAIGAFSLVGALGALAAARAGHSADRGFGQSTSAAALALRLASWLPLAFMPASRWALASTAVHASAGSRGVCTLGAADSAAALVFWAATARPMSNVSASGNTANGQPR
ncbi:putative mFS transporter [Burkholderia thailandensis USAMRU Malaysia |uniref:Transporter, putative n=1 Tax=Burkholderia thailandensis (strain ATCC 700388 / DSM 13276 / CCUG 48851 / CIP 106301 / E264) TaxID=271848 RepID=Q2SWW6_BURTA|nr:transporter, putative [Burkholderia thailandensis E264]AHI74596.1 putative mFS transporter [Burkholderia thailandensis 2002721723]AHI77648.1 putative mFS transporter [Burkholderia thailandensis E444]AIC88063.1 putative mFS transporter [Burkholderia thailandensis USAMRU Malaysia \